LEDAEEAIKKNNGKNDLEFIPYKDTMKQIHSEKK